ncbi:hypothetical protein C0J52_21525 [Blattella germanica]|nr:hypothetical protein C0J52_21525 [Blattella germanica]
MHIEQQTYITTSSENSETGTIAETEDVSKSDREHKEEKEMKRLKIKKKSIINGEYKNQVKMRKMKFPQIPKAIHSAHIPTYKCTR